MTCGRNSVGYIDRSACAAISGISRRGTRGESNGFHIRVNVLIGRIVIGIIVRIFISALTYTVGKLMANRIDYDLLNKNFVANRAVLALAKTAFEAAWCNRRINDLLASWVKWTAASSCQCPLGTQAR